MEKKITTVREPARDIPVRASADILIVGGGPAGLMAAQAAAGEGLKVMLIESRGYLGGNLTIGLPILGFLGQKGNQIIEGLPQRFIDRLQERGAASGHRPCKLHVSLTIIDPEESKTLAQQLMEEAGVEVLMYVFCTDVIREGNEVKGVVIESKAGREAILARTVIDCTGDADVAFRAGVECRKGDAEGGMQPPTLMFSMRGVATQRLRDAIAEHPDIYDMDIMPAESFRNEKFITVGLRNQIAKAREAGIDLPVARTILITGMSEDEIWVNMSRVNGVDPTDPGSYTRGEIEARKQVYQIRKYLRQFVPGFENAWMDRVAPFMGIRESRVTVGKYVLTAGDILACRRFDDAVAVASYPVDLHHPKGGDCTLEYCGDCYDIPYRVLVPAMVEAAQRIETNRSLPPMTVRIMRFTKLLLGLGLAACAWPLSGQNARQEIYADPDKAGGVYYAYTYDNPARTPAPEGYEPFYISHYGRHGSRWLLRASEYTEVLETFGKAAREGALSEFGQDVLRRVERACSDGEGRAGDLTPLGAEQHYGIAERMFESYPEVFRGNARVDAQSTVVVRCVLSMAAFCDQLRRMNPELEITRTANNRTTRYLNFFSTAANPGPAPEYLNLLKSESWIEAEEGFRESRMHPERLMARLFAGGKVPADIDQRELMQQLWALAVNEQDTRSGITFRDLFTPEELYAVWECVNYRFYHQRGPGAFNRGYALRYATALLEEIIARADSALVQGAPSADLRFGHDGNLMPLTCLMAFDGCTAEVSDPDLIADAWRDYRISPMAANIQMIFYRKEGTADILVRILHNEHEMYFPLASARPPYYKWDDLRAFYRRRIAEAKATAAEPPSAGTRQAPGA